MKGLSKETRLFVALAAMPLVLCVGVVRAGLQDEHPWLLPGLAILGIILCVAGLRSLWRDYVRGSGSDG